MASPHPVTAREWTTTGPTNKLTWKCGQCGAVKDPWGSGFVEEAPESSPCAVSPPIPA